MASEGWRRSPRQNSLLLMGLRTQISKGASEEGVQGAWAQEEHVAKVSGKQA